MKIYQVGGAVRDILMRQTPHDIDYVVVGATPAAMLAAGYKQIKKDIPVFINPEDGREYALARRETKPAADMMIFVLKPRLISHWQKILSAAILPATP